MNIFELGWLIIVVALGLGVAEPAGHRFGIVGYILGFVLGVGGGWAALWVIPMFLDFVDGYLRSGIPRRPRCRNGRCVGVDYELTKTLTWKCKCGDEYVKKGRRFLKLDADRKRLPYLKWVPFRGWVPDS
jgi:hypothetical protein